MKVLLLLNFLMIAQSVSILALIPSRIPKKILNLTEFMDLMWDKLSCLQMFNHLCNLLWMDIMFLYLVMDKLAPERHTLWKDLAMIVDYMLVVLKSCLIWLTQNQLLLLGSISLLRFFELYNEQITDLLSESESTSQKIRMGSLESFIELQQEKIDNPLDFSRILQAAFQRRGNDISKLNVSHLIVTVHIYYNNVISGENLYSKLSLVDLAGSEGLIAEDDSSERVTDMLHVMKSLSALGDVLSSLTSRKDVVPYENSMLTTVLADSLGRKSKTLMILNVCPNIANLSETLSSLSFSSRARNATLSLGNRDTIKKWRDV
ncbi:hypothetical protein OIU78_029064, partial [Salix suchowensis]